MEFRHEFKNRRAEHLATQLKNYDFITFQEVFEKFNWRKDYILSEAEKEGLYYKYTLPPWPFCTQAFQKPWFDSGLINMSRFPIVYKDFIVYKNMMLQDAFAQKGVLYTRIVHDPKHSHKNRLVIHMFNTHTQSDNENISHWNKKTHLDEW